MDSPNEYGDELLDYFHETSEDNENIEGSEDEFFDNFDDTIEDIDFSQFKGDFKDSVKEINKILVPTDREVIVEGMKDYDIGRKKVVTPTTPRKPVSKKPIVEKGVFERVERKGVKPKIPIINTDFINKKRPKHLTKDFGTNRSVRLEGSGKKKIAKVLVPNDRKVIVEGVSKFILSQDAEADFLKNIHWYKGEKLKELVLNFNNNSALDFNLELFNPSMPLDYTQSTSLNLNDKIQVAGGTGASYTDVLFNLLANPAMLVNAKFVFSGSSLSAQMRQPMFFKNKNIQGEMYVEPMQIPLKIDDYQFANDIVVFNLMKDLNRPYIPDGMDVIQYKILAGMTVTLAFYYKQVSLKRVLLKEAREHKDPLYY